MAICPGCGNLPDLKKDCSLCDGTGRIIKKDYGFTRFSIAAFTSTVLIGSLTMHVLADTRGCSRRADCDPKTEVCCDKDRLQLNQLGYSALFITAKQKNLTNTTVRFFLAKIKKTLF